MINNMPSKPLSVMVVDDDVLMLQQVSINLGRLAVDNIVLADNAKQALSHIARGDRFDLIVLDLNMPEMDGIEMMRNLAGTQYQGAIALFSGEDKRILKTAESLANAQSLFVVGSLAKPVTEAELADMLNKARPTAHQEKAVQPTQVDSVSEAELRSAIHSGRIVPFFQPKVTAKEVQIESAEVLARWQHPTRGCLSPFVFITLAEESGLIDELTFDLFDKSIALYSNWRKLGYDFTLCFNLSAITLNLVDLPELLNEAVTKYNIPTGCIELELTESQLMDNLTVSLDVLTRLRLKGFGLSIDDFGTGYSSLSQLSQIPFTELKIDRAFVHGANSDPAALAILESSIALAKKLDMTIVTEGVEDKVDWDTVVKAGSDLIQGFYIAKPMAHDDFSYWLTQHKQAV